MLACLLLGSLLTILTVATHAAGSVGGIRILKRFAARNPNSASLIRMIAILCGTALFLFLLHFVESLLWAIAYLAIPSINEITTIEEATYFSVVTFATLGYGDVVINQPWRLLSGIQAMNGLIIMGWSTALFLAVLQRLWSSFDENATGSESVN